MQLYINCITADKILKCKRNDDEVIKRIKLINPQYMENEVYFDVIVMLPDNFNISNKHECNEDYLVISLSNLGNMELNVKDFRDVTLI